MHQLSLFAPEPPPPPLPPVLYLAANTWGPVYHIHRWYEPESYGVPWWGCHYVGQRWMPNEQPSFFYSIAEAVAWAWERGHKLEIPLRTYNKWRFHFPLRKGKPFA